MYEMHSITLGGELTPHVAHRLAAAFRSIICNAETEINLRLDGDTYLSIDGGAPEEDAISEAQVLTYLTACITAGVPAVVETWAVAWGEGGWQIEEVMVIAREQRLSGRYMLGAHHDTNGDLQAPVAYTFGPAAPAEEEYYFGMNGEPLIAITDKTDLRALPRLAGRLLELHEWQPPPLTGSAAFLAERQMDVALAA